MPEPEAADKSTTTPTVIAPMHVAIIGGPGDGGSPMTTGTVGSTPDHQPNLVVTVITPLTAIAVRFVNLYLVSLSGLVTAGGFGLLPLGDFSHALRTASEAALVPAAIGLIKDLATVFGNLEKKHPLATGAI